MSCLFFTLTDNLQPLVTSSVIKGRCIRVYDVAVPGNKEMLSLDCVLHDQKGVRIQTTFPRNLIEKFRNVLEGALICIRKGLKEGCYCIFCRIETIEFHYGEWFCKRCVKKVLKIDNIYHCDRCNKSDNWASCKQVCSS